MRAEPSLSAAEQGTWRTYMEAGRLLFDVLDRELQRDAGLAHTDYEILVRLSEAPHRRLRMSDLAAAMLFSRSRLSHAVSRLEREGLVVRTECGEDARGTFAQLTRRGRAVLRAAAPGHVRGVRRHLFERLTREQVRALGEISRAVRDSLADSTGQFR